MKLMVTGSRHWDDPFLLWSVLDVFTKYPLRRKEKVTLVHGGCLRGADFYANEWAENMPVRIKVYPAQWNLWGNAAGPIRNEEMIYENPDTDYVLAFPLGDSAGTRNCMDIASEKRLTVINFGETE